MTTLGKKEIKELKEQYKKHASIFNSNLKIIKLQLNSQELKHLMIKYNARGDSHLAKILMLRGIEL